MRVQPRAQIVSPMVFWVTAGLIAPGVVDGSGSERPARQQSCQNQNCPCARPRVPPCGRRTPALRACEGVSPLDRTGAAHNAKRGSHRLCAMPVQAGGSPPRAKHLQPRKGRRDREFQRCGQGLRAVACRPHGGGRQAVLWRGRARGSLPVPRSGASVLIRRWSSGAGFRDRCRGAPRPLGAARCGGIEERRLALAPPICATSLMWSRSFLGPIDILWDVS
jgi:hypothetical protein